MTFREWMAARQLLAEEHLGVLARQAAQREDAEFAFAATHAPRG